MSQSIDIREDKVFVHLNGSIFSKEATTLREDLVDYIAKGYKSFIFDFSQVNDIDSAGLGVVVTVRKRVMALGGNVVVHNLSSRTRNLFERT